MNETIKKNNYEEWVNKLKPMKKLTIIQQDKFESTLKRKLKSDTICLSK